MAQHTTGGAAAVAAAIVLALAWPAPESPAAMCVRAGREINRAFDQRWPPWRRAAIVGRVREFSGPGARTAAGVIAGRVETYARELAVGAVDACAATHVRGVQSEALLDLRTACLARRADDLDATLRVLDAMSAKEVDAAMRATGKLPEIAPCGNPIRARRTERSWMARGFERQCCATTP